jgi:eukaryotic-like serine/threonine-protein kinase
MSDAVSRLTAALADRYRIERELGAGGMATVYLAQDLKHQRRVAIKVLRPELAAAIGADRFLREITTTASLRHPHILPLYDSGAAGDTLFYVMPFVDGESLRDRLKREKQLPLDDALQIAREVADALSYAHSRGIVHRDIKPENIMLEAGHAVVADFGIAKAISTASGDTLTQTGMAIGTPSYMSPEQAAGDGELDGRSDLYALGCVLYEMLAGQPPFTGPTVESVVHQHLVAEPRPISLLRPAVPAAVVAALQRALAKAPADRFNPVALFSEAIRPGATTPQPATGASVPARRSHRGVVVMVALAVVAVAAGFVLWRRSSGSTSAGAASVAVLPFVDLSPDRSSVYLGDGMAETIINALANVPGLNVAARTSAFSFRDKAEDVREIGRQLGVATVLEGSVQRAGTHLRVTAQLIKTSDGLHLWSQNFDRDAADIFAVQDEVARAVVAALPGSNNAAAPHRSRATGNPAAYESYLQGLFAWNRRTEADLRQAIRLFEQAIAQDSTYAEAWVGLADAHVLLPFYSSLIPTRDEVPKAEAAARRALALDPNLGPAHAALAYALMAYEWRWAQADSEFRLATALSPGDATAHKWYEDLLSVMGQRDDAFREARRALELDPLSPNVLAIMAELYWGAGRETEAQDELRKALAVNPEHPLALEYAMRVAWSRGDVGQFFAFRQRLEAIPPRVPPATEELRRAYAAGGRKAVLRALLAGSGARPTDRARWNAEIGDFDAAFRDLDRAVTERDIRLPFVTTWKDYAPLWSDPRFATLLTRIDLHRVPQ